VFNPGNTITINGYFMDNSQSGEVHLHMEHVDTRAVTHSEKCLIHSALKISCKVTTTQSSFGNFFVSLQEISSGLRISDDSVLTVLVLPVPVIELAQEQKAFVTSLTSFAQPWTLQIIVKYDDADLMLEFKHIFASQTVCKLVKVPSDFQYFTQRVTWTNERELNCYFENLYIDELTQFCIEVSINGGHTFSATCTTKVFSHRMPLITEDSFIPTHSHVQDIVHL